MALPGRRALILYGSETGNSQEKAGEIDRMCQRLRFSTELEEMDAIKLNTLLGDLDIIVFVISTTGQGQFPRNALNFWKSLRRAKLPPNCLAPVRFTIFGLGDSSYQKFNWAARLLCSRLLRLGASEIFERGEADERHDDGIDSIYQPWAQNLRDFLLATFPLPPAAEPIPASQPLPPRYTLQIVTSMDPIGTYKDHTTLDDEDFQFLLNREKNAALSHTERPRSETEQFDEDWDLRKVHFGLTESARRDLDSATVALGGLRVDVLDKANILKDAPEKYLLRKAPAVSVPVDFPPQIALPIPNSKLATVAMNARVTPDNHWQDVRLLTLDVAVDVFDNMEPTVQPGDVVVIYPQNYMGDVQKLIDLMGWGPVADKPVAFGEYRTPKGYYLDADTTLRDLLVTSIDFNAVPTRMFLEKLADFTLNQDQREKLLELIRPDFTNEFYDFTSRPRRTILEVLAEFNSAKIPLSHVPDMFPVIRGREYSIANGGLHWGKKTIKKTEFDPEPVADGKNSPLGKGGMDGKDGDDKEPAREPKRTAIIMYRIELLIALVEYKTIIRRPRQGLCSRYVKHLPEGRVIRVALKTQTPPPNGPAAAERPLIAIAAGTGIAPVRSLIQDRSQVRKAAETLLFFGCRNEAADFYFHEEWAQTSNLQVVPAFSRDQNLDPPALVRATKELDIKVGNTDNLGHRKAAGLPAVDAMSTGELSASYDQGKTYVQHMIRRHAADICDLLNRDAIICLCGSSGRMPKSVREALRDAAIMGGFSKDAEEAEKALFGEHADKHITFWEETW